MFLNKNLLIFFIFISFVFYFSTECSAFTPEEVLKLSDYARGNVEGIEWMITIDSREKGRRRRQELNVKVRGLNTVAEITAPAGSKGRKLLMLDRNMWFIRPGLRKPVPISPRQKLLGGASNGDIASTNYSGDYRIDKVAEETINGEMCYCYDLTADNKKATYDGIRYWVSQKRHVGIKADFFTVSGKLFKSALFEYDNTIEKEDEIYPFISKMTITSALMPDDVTVMTYRDVEIKAISDAVFNLNLMIQ